MKKEIYYRIPLMFQTMIDHKDPHQEIKLWETSNLLFRKFRIIKMREHQYHFGNLHGFSNRKNKNRIPKENSKK
jgi:hypothetical protein